MDCGYVHKISVSKSKSVKKSNVEYVRLLEDHGIVGDCHAGSKRQVSLLPLESIEKIRKKIPDIKPGDFAENLTTRGLDLSGAEVGRRLLVGGEVILEITGIGKECHEACHIRKRLGECIMPEEGIFTRVVRGGLIKAGDTIEWM